MKITESEIRRIILEEMKGTQSDIKVTKTRGGMLKITIPKMAFSSAANKAMSSIEIAGPQTGKYDLTAKIDNLLIDIEKQLNLRMKKYVIGHIGKHIKNFETQNNKTKITIIYS